MMPGSVACSVLSVWYNTNARWLNDRWWSIAPREESPGSTEQQQSLTATEGDLRESATETYTAQ